MLLAGLAQQKGWEGKGEAGRHSVFFFVFAELFDTFKPTISTMSAMFATLVVIMLCLSSLKQRFPLENNGFKVRTIGSADL